MGRFFLTTAAAAALGIFASTASALAQCPNNQSFFGTIQRVSGDTLTVRTADNRWADVRLDRGAKVNANGMQLQQGAYVGAYGCVTPDGVFHASQVTLANSASSYGERLTGTVQRVESGRLIVRQSNGTWGTWYVPNSGQFSVGQRITGVGMVSASGVFYPQSINGQGMAYTPDNDRDRDHRNTITLTGVVQRITASTIVVWEPSRKTTGEWVVSHPHNYRVGQKVTARGTEDTKGHFYPESVSIQ